MRRWFRTHEVRVYQTMFLGVILLAAVILGKGLFSIFREEMQQSAKKALQSAAEALVEQVGNEENALLAYAKDLHGEEKLFAGLTGTKLSGWAENTDTIPAASGNVTSERPDDEFLVSEGPQSDGQTDNPSKIEGDTEDAGIFSIPDKSIFDETTANSGKENEATASDTEQDALAELAAKENNAVKETETLEVKRETGNISPIPAEKDKKPEENSKENNTPAKGTETKDEKKGEEETTVVSVRKLLATEYSLEKMKNLNYLLANFYIVDSSTKATASLFQTDILLNKDMTIEKSKDEVQILIYHTHASETYSDSKAGVQEDTVVGPGNYLTELLTQKGYVVYHDQTAYDKKDGKDNRNYAYSTARPHIEKFLKENPSVQVVIDLHRDSGTKRATMVNGKETAQIMLFNGLCRNANGPIADLENPYILDNLAFSLQANLVGRSMYPGLMYKIYLKNYRYNQHLCPRYLLIELGTQQNTVQEAYNAMEPLSEILDQVLTNP